MPASSASIFCRTGPLRRGFFPLWPGSGDPLGSAAAALKRLPRPFTAVILGIGEDGHTASLFPDAPGLARALDPAGSGDFIEVPAAENRKARLSLTLRALCDTTQVMLIFEGAAKRRIFEEALKPGQLEELPVRAILRQKRAACGRLLVGRHVMTQAKRTADDYPVLTGDIGGTNARFGLVTARGAMPAEIKTLSNASYPSLVAALGHYLEMAGSVRPRRACIAVAGPVESGRFHLTNRPQWDADLASVSKAHALSLLTVINDFEALAESVPLLEQHELRPVGSATAAYPDGPKAVIGPGTGLGIGVSVRTPLGWMAVPGEGGHMELATPDPLGRAVLDQVRKTHGRVSAERCLSGPGIEQLHLALCEVQGRLREPLTAAALSERAIAGESNARQTVAVFFSLLASLCRRRGAAFRRPRRRVPGRRGHGAPGSTGRSSPLPRGL